jgi:hypothetical protein
MVSCTVPVLAPSGFCMGGISNDGEFFAQLSREFEVI